MAESSVVLGNNLLLKYGVAGSEALVEATTSDKISITAGKVDVSTKSSDGWDYSKAGRKSWEIGVEGKLDRDRDPDFDTLFAAITAGTEASVLFGGVEVGDKYYTGKVLITNLEMSGEQDGVVTWSATLTGNGALTSDTVAA
jgi:predicted secreted protein